MKSDDCNDVVPTKFQHNQVLRKTPQYVDVCKSSFLFRLILHYWEPMTLESEVTFGAVKVCPADRKLASQALRAWRIPNMVLSQLILNQPS